MFEAKKAQLTIVLMSLIKKYADKPKIEKIIVDEFLKRGLRISIAKNILTTNLDLQTLEDNDKDLFILFSFTKGFYNALTTIDEITEETFGTFEEYSNLIVDNYFTSLEVEQWNNLVLEKKETKKDEWVFEDMTQVAEGHWRGEITAQYLAELDAENEIYYNWNTQREPTIDMFGLKKIKVLRKKIQTITNRLLTGKQYSDEIKLNVLHDNINDKVEYDSKNKRLIVKSGIKNIFDGYHRKTANSLAIAENPELNFVWGLSITNWSEPQAREFMTQINKQEPMSYEHTSQQDPDIKGNNVVDEMSHDSRSEFAGKIKSLDNELKFDGLTTKLILAKAIGECYKKELENKLQISKIAKHISNIINYIMGLNIQDFIIDVKKSREISFISNKHMFVGYIALSKKLYENDKWESILDEVFTKIDFSKENSIWTDIGLTKEINNKELSKKTREKLYEFFNNLV